MKKTRRWAAALLAAVLVLATLPAAALAEDNPWMGSTDAANFEEFKAALEDEAAESICVVGDIEVAGGTLEEPLRVDKPVLVTGQGSLHLAEGAVVYCDVDMGLFQYEGEPFWEPIARDMAAILIWENNDGCRRLLFGSQPDLDVVLEGQEAPTTAIFRGPVTLDREIEIQELCAVEGDLTVEGSLTVDSYLNVSGDMTVAEGGALTLGYRGWVEGDVEQFGGVGGSLDCGGTFFRPHLAVRWEDGHYDDALYMTPFSEYELTFALLEYKNGSWDYTEVVPTVSAPLVYGKNENHSGLPPGSALFASHQQCVLCVRESGGVVHGRGLDGFPLFERPGLPVR